MCKVAIDFGNHFARSHIGENLMDDIAAVSSAAELAFVGAVQVPQSVAATLAGRAVDFAHGVIHQDIGVGICGIACKLSVIGNHRTEPPSM